MREILLNSLNPKIDKLEIPIEFSVGRDNEEAKGES